MIKSVPHSSRILLGLLTVLFLMPGFCQASVFLNEIAWMGDSSSANHEWIELYNDGAATVVDGWILSDGRNLSIELAGTVPAGSYVVLERTSDESAPGPAFLLYTGALPNTGGTLRLETAQGQLVDLVSGGENWAAIGGDNATKETAQYTAKGWITATPTPGAPNKTESTTIKSEPTQESEETETKEKTNTSAKDKKSVETVRLTLPDITLALMIDAQTVGYVNQTIPFVSKASGIGPDLLSSLQYQWNFGDGTVDQSAAPSHRFQFPGTYVVTLHAQYKRQKQITRHEITILPVALSLTQNKNGDIQVNNDSPYEVDISGYTIQGRETFVFPDYSLILPNQTITIIRKKVTDKNPTLVTIKDAHNVQLASLTPPVTSSFSTVFLADTRSALVSQTSQRNNSAVTTVSPPTPTISLASVAADTEVTSDEMSLVEAEEFAAESTLVSGTTATPTLNTLDRTQRLSYVGLIIVILLGIFSVYFTPRRNLDE